MARELRIEYPGAVYHVMSRGNERKDIFRDDRDKEFFLSLFSRAAKKYGLIVHCYVLMDNHYHLLLETPYGNLSTIMKWLNVTYTSYFNWRHKRSGHLFQGRFKSKLVEKNEHMVQASIYIHLNPFKASMEERLGSYKFSSIREYVRSHRNKDVDVDTILNLLSEDREAAIKQYRKLLQKEKHSESDLGFKEVIAGSKEFVKENLEKLKEKGKGNHAAVRRLTQNRISPSELIQMVCRELDIEEQNLREKDHQSQMAKKLLIYLIRNNTELTNRETGALFGLTESGVTQSCYRLEKTLKKDKKLQTLLESFESIVSCHGE